MAHQLLPIVALKFKKTSELKLQLRDAPLPEIDTKATKGKGFPVSTDIDKDTRRWLLHAPRPSPILVLLLPPPVMSFAAFVAAPLRSLSSPVNNSALLCKSHPRMTASPTTTPAISRRTFSTLLAFAPFASLLPATAADVSGFVTPYKDLPKGFTILKPNGWNEFEALQDNYDIKWQDVIQPLEFITVLTSPVAKDKSLTDLGTAEQVGTKLATARNAKLINAAEKDIEGIPAYLFEIKRESAHQLTLLTVNKQKLYSVNASCSEKRWNKREKLLRAVVDSFRPKL